MAYSLASTSLSDPISLVTNGAEIDIEKDVKCLRPLDQLLRCNICFDYLNICMMTACSHNYCSFCIRKYLTYKAQCPVCFEVATEPELRNNRLIDEVVKHYKMLRTTLQSCLRLSEESDSRLKDTDSELSIKSSSEIFEGECVNVDLPSVSGAIMDLTDEVCQEPDEKDKVLCPVCSVPVLMDNINNHLDMCLVQGERKKSFRRPSGERRKSLPKVIYHFMSDKELKKRLKDFGLSIAGDRQALIKRHKAFLVQYNAECDSLNPRSVIDIIKQIENEEEEEKSLNSLQPVFQFDKRTEQGKIELEQQKYLVQHNQQFSQLISDIRRRKSQQEERNQNAINNQNCDAQCDMIPSISSDVNCNNVDELHQHANHETDTKARFLKHESSSLSRDVDPASVCIEEEGKLAGMLEEEYSNSKSVKKVLAPPPSPAGDSKVILQSRKRKKKKENEHHCSKR